LNGTPKVRHKILGCRSFFCLSFFCF